MSKGLGNIRSRLGESGRSRLAALTDQALMSASTLVQSVALVRLLPVAEFGRFSTFLAFLLVSVGVQKAVLLTPMVVQSSREDLDYTEWSRFSAHVSLVLAVVLCFVGVGATIADEPSFAVVLFVSALGLLPYMRYEFARRSLILRRDYMGLVQASLVFVGAVFAAVVIIWFVATTFLQAAIITIVAYFVGAAHAAHIGQEKVAGSNSCSVGLIRKHWGVMSWNTIAMVPYMVFNNGMPILVGAILGPTAVGLFSSSRIFLAPLTMLNQAIDSVDKPAAGRAMRSHGIWEMIRSLRGTLLVVGGIGLPYVVVVSFVADPLKSLVFGDRYQGSTVLIYAWLATGLAMVVSQPFESALMLMGRFRVYFVSRLVAAAVAISVLLLASDIAKPERSVFAATCAWYIALGIGCLSAIFIVQRALSHEVNSKAGVTRCSID